MRYVCLLLFLVGCGNEPLPAEPKPPVVTVTGDPMECKLVDGACTCVIPEYSLEAIAAMSTRCTFLRNVAPSY